jgi:citrate synthase
MVEAAHSTGPAETAQLTLRGRTHALPVVVGTEHEVAVDIADLRSQTGLITLDEGYGNTGSCTSQITFIDGEKGILRYRGYPIEELAENCTFIETSYMLIFGELPNQAQLAEFRQKLTENQFIHESMRHHFEGFPPDASPMAILSAMLNALGCYEHALPKVATAENFLDTAARVISRVRTIAAASYQQSRGHPIVYPRTDLRYTANFLHMMFSMPHRLHDPDPDIVRALDLIFVLHADHEQNCSTSTVRMVASSQANVYACIAAGICALWGPLHGGANEAVIRMLEQIQRERQSLELFLDSVKQKDSKVKLMGFGHRVYKNFDPRARIIKAACDRVLEKLGIRDPLLDLAKRLEETALKDPYFIERKLYPNVDFYSGIILKAIGIPLEMFTVIFAIGRIPGWLAHFREVSLNPKARIARPRQIYMGPTLRSFAPVEKRK